MPSNLRGYAPGAFFTCRQVKDRLMRLDFCRSKLLQDFELRTEEQVAQVEGEIGVVYYRLVSHPIDLLTIRQKINNNA